MRRDGNVRRVAPSPIALTACELFTDFKRSLRSDVGIREGHKHLLAGTPISVQRMDPRSRLPGFVRASVDPRFDCVAGESRSSDGFSLANGRKYYKSTAPSVTLPRRR